MTNDEWFDQKELEAELRRGSFILRDDIKGSIAFVGNLLASVTSRNGSREKERHFTEIDLYQTDRGRYIVAKRNRHAGGKVRSLWKSFRSPADVQRWLGDGPLSLLAYQQAGWGI